MVVLDVFSWRHVYIATIDGSTGRVAGVDTWRRQLLVEVVTIEQKRLPADMTLFDRIQHLADALARGGWRGFIRSHASDELKMLDDVLTHFTGKYPLAEARHEAKNQKEINMSSTAICGPLPDYNLGVTITADTLSNMNMNMVEVDPGSFSPVPYGVMFALYQTPGVARRVELPVLFVNGAGTAQVMDDAGQLTDAAYHTVVRSEQTYIFERIKHRTPQ